METMNDLCKVTNPLVTQEDIDDHIGIGLVVRRDDGKIVILQHKKYGFFTIPVGKASLKELPIFGAKKEAKEELGIDVVSLLELGTFTKTYDRGNGIVTNIQTIIFEILDYNGEIINAEPKKHPMMVFRHESSIIDMYGKDNLSDATLFYLYLKEILERECKKI